MRKLISLIAILIFALLIESCSLFEKSNKNKTENTMEEINTNSLSYSLIVSFYSPGNGIDHKVLKELQDFLHDNYPQLIYETVSWGKEGERDLCFKMDENDLDIEKIITEIENLISKSSRVRIYKDSQKKH